MRIVFLSIPIWLVAGVASAGADSRPSLLSSVVADEIWAVTATEVSWEKPGLEPRVNGSLSVTVDAVLRGKKREAGTAFKIKMWAFRLQAQGQHLGQDVGSPWPYLSLKKGGRLVLFLAKDVQGYDIWQSSVAGKKIIAVKPYAESLVRDVALINQCLQAKDVGAAIWEVLQKPKTIGEEFGAFAGEAIFARRLTSAEVRRNVIRLLGGDAVPTAARMRMIHFLERYIGHLREQPLPANQTQPLVDLLVHNLLDPKAGNARLGMSDMLYNLLVNQKLGGKVKIAKSAIEPLVKTIQSVADSLIDGPQKAQELTEVLKKIAGN